MLREFEGFWFAKSFASSLAITLLSCVFAFRILPESTAAAIALSFSLWLFAALLSRASTSKEGKKPSLASCNRILRQLLFFCVPLALFSDYAASLLKTEFFSALAPAFVVFPFSVGLWKMRSCLQSHHQPQALAAEIFPPLAGLVLLWLASLYTNNALYLAAAWWSAVPLVYAAVFLAETLRKSKKRKP